MPEELRLMCVLAHPDDESLGFGGTLAKYAAEGIATYLVMATRGERGWQGDERDDPGPTALGRIRAAELCAAARILGLRGVEFLDYADGELHQAGADKAIGQIVACLREIRPQVVVTFGPDGATGHPDHIAMCQFTTAAIIAAADPGYAPLRAGPPHRVDKCYYLAASRAKVAAYAAAFGDTAMTVDGVKRSVLGWDEWAITTRLDTSAYWQQVWQAISCHRSQLPQYEALAQLPTERHRELWGTQEFYRVFSLVGGPVVEQDLFVGLR
jgi:LmbE family N-acetylglucosaminyl deacetylase